MKKLLLIVFILTSSQVFASCLIDGGNENVCSIDRLRKPISNTFTPAPFMGDPDDEPDVRVNPTKSQVNENFMREFGPKNSDYNYNANCQFGVCNNPGGSSLFPFFQR